MTILMTVFRGDGRLPENEERLRLQVSSGERAG
jgi:hypothetical protein